MLKKDEMQEKKKRPKEPYQSVRRGGSAALDTADRLFQHAPCPMILLIDNYDSFTYNLYQQLVTLKQKTIVVPHDKITIKEITKLQPKKIIISPGPGRPQESGISPEIIKTFHKDIPILGVCLGHELIGELFGARVIPAKNILHGKTSEIHHSAKNLFTKIPQKIQVARYHSLILDRVPENFTLEAWATLKVSDSNKPLDTRPEENFDRSVQNSTRGSKFSDNAVDDGLFESLEIMAIKHKQYPLHGIQFHPESFMTDHGNQIIQNLLAT